LILAAGAFHPAFEIAHLIQVVLAAALLAFLIEVRIASKTLRIAIEEASRQG
jgi:hypothetical protein